MMKTNRLHGPSDSRDEPRDDLGSWGATADDMGRQAVMPDIWGSLNTGAAAFVGGAAGLPSQALYLTETGDTAAISVNDLHQGQIGDCFLISSVGELALTHPDAIGKMIRSNADGTETVTLYVDQRGRLPTFGTTAFKPVSVTVSNVFPSYSVNNGATQDMVANTKEIWPQILEKAVATLDGGYGAIAYGGNPVIPMEELTGHAATYMSPARLSLAMLQSFIAAGDLITMDTAWYRPATLVTLWTGHVGNTPIQFGERNHGLACGECDGPTPVFYRGLSAGRRADEQSLFTVRDQPQDGLQMVEPVSRFRRRGIG